MTEEQLRNKRFNEAAKCSRQRASSARDERDMPNLPVFSESAFPYFALGFGLIGFVALKIWGHILDYKHNHPKGPDFARVSLRRIEECGE